MADTVVIARPLQQCAQLAQALRLAGFAPVILPMLEIAPLADESALRAALTRLEDYALVAFVSPNAIDAAFRVRPHWPVSVALAVMGEGSLRSLQGHGISEPAYTIHRPRDAERTDSETLLHELDLPALRGRRVLIIRGQDGRELLADSLRAAGVQVEQVAAYRRSAPALDEQRRQALQDSLQQDPVWIISSSEGLRVLLDQVREVTGELGLNRLLQQRLLVPHARIEDSARASGFVRILRSSSGDEAMLAKLQLPAANA